MKLYSEAKDSIEYIYPLSVAKENVSEYFQDNGSVLPKKEIFVSNDNDLTAFFAVGMVINIIILVAFFVWAFNQWKKK